MLGEIQQISRGGPPDEQSFQAVSQTSRQPGLST